MTTDFEEYSPIQNEDGREVTIFISDEDYSRFLDAKDWLFITETDMFHRIMEVYIKSGSLGEDIEAFEKDDGRKNKKFKDLFITVAAVRTE